MSTHAKKIVHFLYEAGQLAKTPRSYYAFLGHGHQSVAEHINRVTYISYALSKMAGLNTERMILMALFHDFAEARTGDLNYVNQQYVESDEEKVIEEVVNNLPFGSDLDEQLAEYKQRQTRESQLVKDADQLEFILSLKEEADQGNARAQQWIATAMKRLKTPEAQELAHIAIETPADEWWTSAKDDSWWIHRQGAKGSDKRF